MKVRSSLHGEEKYLADVGDFMGQEILWYVWGQLGMKRRMTDIKVPKNAYNITDTPYMSVEA